MVHRYVVALYVELLVLRGEAAARARDNASMTQRGYILSMAITS